MEETEKPAESGQTTDNQENNRQKTAKPLKSKKPEGTLPETDIPGLNDLDTEPVNGNSNADTETIPETEPAGEKQKKVKVKPAVKKSAGSKKTEVSLTTKPETENKSRLKIRKLKEIVHSAVEPKEKSKIEKKVEKAEEKVDKLKLKVKKAKKNELKKSKRKRLKEKLMKAFKKLKRRYKELKKANK
jgi:hypothetical protein